MEHLAQSIAKVCNDTLGIGFAFMISYPLQAPFLREWVLVKRRG